MDISCVSATHRRRGCQKVATEFFLQEGLGPVACCAVCAKRELRTVEQRRKFFAKPQNQQLPVTKRPFHLANLNWGQIFEMKPITRKQYEEMKYGFSQYC